MYVSRFGEISENTCDHDKVFIQKGIYSTSLQIYVVIFVEFIVIGSIKITKYPYLTIINSIYVSTFSTTTLIRISLTA